MAQTICKTHILSSEEEVFQNQTITSRSNEATEMVAAVMSIANDDQVDDESSDSDNYWSYEEYAIIKEYYENEEDQGGDEEESELLLLTDQTSPLTDHTDL